MLTVAQQTTLAECADYHEAQAEHWLNEARRAATIEGYGDAVALGEQAARHARFAQALEAILPLSPS